MEKWGLQSLVNSYLTTCSPLPPLEAILVHQRFLRVICSESVVDYVNHVFTFFIKLLFFTIEKCKRIFALQKLFFTPVVGPLQGISSMNQNLCDYCNCYCLGCFALFVHYAGALPPDPEYFGFLKLNVIIKFYERMGRSPPLPR